MLRLFHECYTNSQVIEHTYVYRKRSDKLFQFTGDTSFVYTDYASRSFNRTSELSPCRNFAQPNKTKSKQDYRAYVSNK